MGKYGWIIIAAIAAIGLYLLLRKEDKVAAAAQQVQAENPGMTTQEATATAAAQVAEQAADTAAQVEVQHQLDELAATVRELTTALATAQAIAIVSPTPKAIATAKQVEADTSGARATLETEWRAALTDAETQLGIARTAAEAAMTAYGQQLTHVNRIDAVVVYEHIGYGGRWQRLTGTTRLSDLRNQPIGSDTISSMQVRQGFRVKLYEHTNYAGDLEADLIADCSDLRQYDASDAASSLIVEDTVARETLNSIKTSALAACTAARLVTERALTITADLRLLGLLLTEAARLDTIAIAVRNKVADIESRLAAQ